MAIITDRDELDKQMSGSLPRPAIHRTHQQRSNLMRLLGQAAPACSAPWCTSSARRDVDDIEAFIKDIKGSRMGPWARSSCS